MHVSSLRPSHLLGGLSAFALGAALFSWAPWSAQVKSEAAPAPRASNVAMNCAAGQQALVRQALVNSEIAVTVECAGPAAPVSAPALDEAPRVQTVPAVYRTPAAPARTYARASTAARPAAVRPVERRRDWKREALIIGGSTGAGAGIGGLIGGKKGALIGAAIGGGGAALWRATK